MSCETNPFAFFSWLFANGCAQTFGQSFSEDPFQLTTYLLLFAATYLFELPMYCLGLRKQFSFKKILLINLVVNLATHPLVGGVFPSLSLHYRWNYGQYVGFSEVFAPLVESLILWIIFKVGTGRAFVTAFAANLFSWLVGGYLVLKVMSEL